MAHLYELTKDYEELFVDIDNFVDENGEVKAEFNDKLNELTDGIREKAINIAEFIKRLDNDEEAYAKEIARLTALKKRTTKKKEYLKQYLINNLTHAQIDKVEDIRATLSFRETEKVEVNLEELPKRYCRQTFEADKIKLKELLKQGKKIKGAGIIVSKSLIIK